jgi:hypothetical protein
VHLLFLLNFHGYPVAIPIGIANRFDLGISYL